MSKTYDLIAASLNEIINDLEATDGKNLKRETISSKIIPIDSVGKTHPDKHFDRLDKEPHRIRRHG